jgi:hypothetical protein
VPVQPTSDAGHDGVIHVAVTERAGYSAFP